MERAAEMEGRRSPPARRRPGRRALGVLFVVLLALAGWNVWDVTREPEVFTPAEEETGLRAEIYLAVEQIEAFRRQNGSLPVDLARLGLDTPELSYVRDANRYRLVAATNRVQVAYETGQDLGPFRGAFDRVLGDEGTGGDS
jgi:hypothetical protein